MQKPNSSDREQPLSTDSTANHQQNHLKFDSLASPLEIMFSPLTFDTVQQRRKSAISINSTHSNDYLNQASDLLSVDSPYELHVLLALFKILTIVYLFF